MQIQNNYHQSPNFGMALILKPGARKSIEEGGMAMIGTIKKAGQIVNNTKQVHLSIGHKAIPVIETPYANKYMRYFSPEEPTALFPEFLHVKTIWAGTEATGQKFGSEYRSCIKMENAVAAEKAYNELKNAKNEIERGAIFTRILDDHYTAQFTLNEANAKNKKLISEETDRLFEQYGTK